MDNTSQNLSTLIAALKAVEDDQSVQAMDSFSTECLPCEGSVLDAVNIAADFSLSDYDVRKALKEAGYPVSCGERDSFGWVTAVIQTSKGQVLV